MADADPAVKPQKGTNHALAVVEAEKARSTWRWHPRINGAVIYVERVTEVRTSRLPTRGLLCAREDGGANMFKYPTRLAEQRDGKAEFLVLRLAFYIG